MARRPHLFRLAVLGCLACGAVALPAPATAADREVITDTGMDLAAHGGYFAWTTERARDRRLVLFERGERRIPPIRPIFNLQPFGLGRDGRGRPVAVYPRCKTSRPGCDLYELNLNTGQEHKLRALSHKRRSEPHVAVSDGRYLFTRTHIADRETGRSTTQLFSARRRGPLRRVTNVVLALGQGRSVKLSDTTVTDVAVRARVAAVAFVGWISVIHLARRGQDRGCLTAANLINPDPTVVLTKRFVYWTEEFHEAGVGLVRFKIMRRRVPSRSCVQRGASQTLRILPRHVFDPSVAVMGGRVFYTRTARDIVTDPRGPRSVFEMTDPPIRDR